MKNILQGLAITFLSLILACIIGKIFVLDPLNKEITDFNAQEAKWKAESQFLSGQIAKLKKQQESGQGLNVATRLLSPGEEATLLRKLLDTASATAVALHGLKLLPMTKIKPSENQESDAPAAQPKIDPTKLDANGMPIGLTDSDENQNFFIEIVPIQMTLKGKYQSWGRFFSAIHKQPPLYGIRNLSFSIEPSGFAKGTLDLIFPVNKGPDAGAASSQATNE